MDGAGDQPDNDLREADGAHADELAGQHVAGLHGCQHHFEDARGLFLNDGAGDIHAVDHGGHGEQQGHDVALPERSLGVALDDAAVFLHLVGVDRMPSTSVGIVCLFRGESAARPPCRY